jgi:glutamate-1-semialdehyde 2,1-aminomutase
MQETAQTLDSAERVLAGATLGMFKLPPSHALVIDRGEGCSVWDLEGREFIDYVLGSGPMILGHAHPTVLEAVTHQAARGSTFYGLNKPAIDLAEKIVDASSCAEQVRFATSGTDATFSAMRLARAYTGKEKILKFDGGWHGGHDYAQQDADPDRPGYARALSDGIPQGATDTVLICPFNDLPAAEKYIIDHADELAAVIVEPLQRAIAPNEGFLPGLAAIAKAQGVILILDEIVTGFRLAWGGAQERYHVTPDLVVYGKTISGGYPLSAICGRADIMNCAAPERKGQGNYAFISGTFNGNPVSCSAGIATLSELAKPGIYAHLHEVSKRLRTGLEAIGQDLGLPLQLLGDGPVLQPFFSDQPIKTHAESQDSDLAMQKAFGLGMLEQGYFVNPTGKLYLSTQHTPEIVDRTLEVARSVLTGLK